MSVPRPGPSSTSWAGTDRRPCDIHSVRNQMPSVSPNSYEISGEVTKSPVRPNGSGCLMSLKL